MRSRALMATSICALSGFFVVIHCSASPGAMITRTSGLSSWRPANLMIS